MTLRNFENGMLDMINRAKDIVKVHVHNHTATWHKALFDNNCLNSSIGIFVYGDCIVYGFVYIDWDYGIVDARTKDMSLLQTWEINNECRD